MSWRRSTLKGDVHSLPCIAYQRQFLQGHVHVPHIVVQAGDVAEVQDQVPGYDEHGIQRR